MRRGRMTQHISQKLNNLFKNYVLFVQFLFEKLFKNWLVVYEFLESAEESPKRADLDQIAKQIFLIRIFVNIF